MKKTSLLLMTLLCATLSFAQHYGILVNGQMYFEGTKTDEFEGFVQYLAHVPFKCGDYFQLYDAENKSAWVKPLNTYSEPGFTYSEEDGKYYSTVTGCYDCYIKIKWQADELYIGNGSNCGEGEDVSDLYGGAVPRECEAVLMQAFFNESYDPTKPGVSEYGDTKWTTLTPQAEEIGQFIDYVWLPPSAYGDGAGYHPKNYSNQNSNWGTRAELEALISALHNAGSKVIADIVINHCAGWTSWCDFPEMDFGEYGKFQPDASYICKDDEVNKNTEAGACYGKATGNADDGENWDGARDWAHDMPQVQEMFIAYLKWMRNVMHYDGFRYDKGDGFHNKHHYNYNKNSLPEIAFMECYKGTDDIAWRINDAHGDIMALDFDLKWHVFNSFAGWNYNGDRGPRGDCLMSRGDGRHSVTFIESHDWFLRPDNENEFGGRGNSMTPALKGRLLQANAFMLSMPGVPCIFYPHWVKYKEKLKPMILARKWAGVHSESEVKDEYATGTGYQATIVGHNGWLILCLGDKANKQGFEGFTLATSNYSTMDGHNESYEIWVLSDKPKPEGLDGGEGGGGDEGQCKDGPYGVKINGTKVVDAPLFGDPDAQGRIQYMASCVELKAGDVIQLVNQSCDATWMVDLDPYGEYANFEGGKAANQLTCNVAGKYDFYIKLSMDLGDLVYVENSQTCSGGGGDDPTPDPGYSTSAPEKCPDVMLQAFYWNSYDDQGHGRTRWINLVNGTSGSTAEELGQWFDLIWLPPMSKSTGGSGYIPSKYDDLGSDWGTKRKLVEMIDIFHNNGARVVADIVINHGAALNGWCDFAQLDFGEYGKYQPDASWICSTDEMFSNPSAGACASGAKGNADDGYGDEANYESARDWDHSQQKVRDMFKAYLKWLRNDIKVDGFRYDYCKGFHNSHIDDYNKAAQAYFSVMEYWDGSTDGLQYHLNDAKWNTLTFDFATKYTAFNDGIAKDNYGNLKGAGLPGVGKARYAVTFLDSHDTYQRQSPNEFCGDGKSMTECLEKIPQCYAYLLSMPGVPCVFWPHWMSFKDEIKAMINARYKAGVHSESPVSDEAGSGFYKATITGTNGQIRLLLGPNSGYGTTPAGFTLAVKGLNYGVYYKMNNPRGDKDTERQPIEEAIEDVQGDNVQSTEGVKFIQDGKLYIRCGEYIFDVMGGRVK